MSKKIEWKFMRLYHDFFEILLPCMIYKGNETEKEDFIDALWKDGKELVHVLFYNLCRENGISCPDKTFAVRSFKKGGINIIQISILLYDTNISDILRVYLLFTECDGKRIWRKYFVIRQFENSKIFIMYVTPQIEQLLGEEVKECNNDISYEYWRIVNIYTRLVIRDMEGD